MTKLRSVGLGLWLLAIGCAHQEAEPKSTAVETSPEQAEIAKLEKSITESKKSLHAANSNSESAVPMSSGEGGRCDGVCQAAEEICTCHRRICKLALDIADEPSANSCRRAQRECEEAGKLCAACH